MKIATERIQAQAAIDAERIKQEAAIERQRLRNERKATEKVAQPALQPEEQIAQPDAQLVDELSTSDKIVAFFRDKPEGSIAAAGRYAGVSRQAASRIVNRLEQDGVITRNGAVRIND